MGSHDRRGRTRDGEGTMTGCRCIDSTCRTEVVLKQQQNTFSAETVSRGDCPSRPTLLVESRFSPR